MIEDLSKQRLEILLLGSPQVRIDRQPVSFKTDKALALLAYLAVRAGKTVRREAVAGLLWPEVPEQKARHNLRQALLHVRQALGRTAAAMIDASRHKMRFQPGADTRVDVVEFTRLVAATHNHDHDARADCAACAKMLETAAALYQDDFLAHFSLADNPSFAEWLLLQREWLRREMLEALHVLANHHLQRHMYEQATQYARRQVTMDPVREAGYRQLMQALAGNGRYAEALSQFSACRQTLQEELGVPPSDATVALYEAIKRKQGTIETGQVAPSVPAPHNLPRQFTPFVGRQSELAEISGRLDQESCALLTILGPGGVGKTRLALAVARQRLNRYGDGVWFVPLAPVVDPALIVTTIANQLDLSLAGTADPQERLLAYLRPKQLLLLLDNIEHLRTGSALILEILRAAPGVQVLVTSREALNFHAEILYELAGLPVPPDRAARSAYAAVELFADRAARLQHDFHISETNAAAVGYICRLVAGMPLALELAAAQVRQADCTAIGAAIATNMDSLATAMPDVPPRQRSLRAVFAYSWRLLDTAEQMLLPQLGIFRGGFTAAAAAAIAGATAADLEGLQDKSLLFRDENGRYDMHEILRQYATEELERDTPTAKAVRDAHALHYAAYTEAQHRQLNSDRQQLALVEMTQELGNVYRGWHWAVSQVDLALLGRFTDGLWAYFDDSGLYRDGLALFQRALSDEAILSAAETTDRVLAYVTMAAAFFHMRLGQYPESRRHFEQALAAYQSLDDPVQTANCLYYLGSIAGNMGEMDTALAYLQASRDRYLRLESDRLVANVLTRMGSVLEQMGRYGEAEKVLRDALALKREIGMPTATATSLNNLALLLWRTGSYDEAERLLQEYLEIFEKLENPSGIAIGCSNLARVLITRGEYARARELLQQALTLEETVQDRRHTATVLGNLGLVHHYLGDGDTAVARLAQSLEVGRDAGNSREVAYASRHLGLVQTVRGDWAAARSALMEALQLAQRLNLRPLLLSVLVTLAQLRRAEGTSTDELAPLLAWPHGHPAAWYQTRQEAVSMLAELGVKPDAALQPTDDKAKLEAFVADLLA